VCSTPFGLYRLVLASMQSEPLSATQLNGLSVITLRECLAQLRNTRWLYSYMYAATTGCASLAMFGTCMLQA